MALISANTIIRSLAALHLIVAYYLLTSPVTVANHNLVVVISAAVGLPLPDIDAPILSLAAPSPSNALLAAVLGVFALSDLAATSLREDVALFYFSSQTPLRLLVYFGLTAWSYSYRPGGPFAGRAESEALAAEGLLPEQTAFARGIGSGVVFSWGFIQVITWFWIFITLRDERKEAAAKEVRRKGE